MQAHGGWRVRGAGLLLVVAALGACGTDDGSGSGDDDARASESPSATSQSKSPSKSPSKSTSPPADMPGCADVWRDGAKLPRGYRGCVDGGELVERDVLTCSSGQRMIRYADRFYGVLGGTVHQTAGPLEKDRDYRAAFQSCKA
jgi:hypothetical protein